MDLEKRWLTIKRKQNGYRVYTENDINKLKIIRTLRNPEEDEDIVTVCDKLLTSLDNAGKNAYSMLQ